MSENVYPPGATLGRLILDQRNENGFTVLVGAVGIAIFPIVLAVALGEAWPALWALLPAALVPIGLFLSRSGHRLHENGVELYSPRRTVQVRFDQMFGVHVEPVQIVARGTHNRTEYHIAIKPREGPKLRFHHVAYAGRELAIETFLKQCPAVDRAAAVKRQRR
jgi:hypothetical protein